MSASSFTIFLMCFKFRNKNGKNVNLFVYDFSRNCIFYFVVFVIKISKAKIKIFNNQMPR